MTKIPRYIIRHEREYYAYDDGPWVMHCDHLAELDRVNQEAADAAEALQDIIKQRDSEIESLRYEVKACKAQLNASLKQIVNTHQFIDAPCERSSK